MSFLGVLGGIVGGLAGGWASNKAAGVQADAARDAAQAQLTAARESNALTREMFDKQTALIEPWRQSGITAQNRLMHLLGLQNQAPLTTMGGAIGGIGNRLNGLFGRTNTDQTSDFGKYTGTFDSASWTQDPGYAFRMSEGVKALERSAAARGGLLSGATLKGIQRYGQDMASQEYQNAFNRYYAERDAVLNPLQSLAGTGLTTSNRMGNAGMSMASTVGKTNVNAAEQSSNALMQGANARASGYVGMANALTKPLGFLG